MNFISHEHAERISKWCEKHPKEFEEYSREHRELSELFIDHKISYEEFKKRSDAIKEKYNFLGE